MGRGKDTQRRIRADRTPPGDRPPRPGVRLVDGGVERGRVVPVPRPLKCVPQVPPHYRLRTYITRFTSQLVCSCLQAVSLLPADTAARALLEMRDADAPFLNLMHPEPVPWPTLATPLAETLGLQTVPFPEWVALLAQSGRGHSAEDEVALARENPALKLLDYFVQGTTIEGTPFLGMCAMDMSEALRVSAALRDVQPIDKEDVLRWVAYWQRCGFL